MIQNFYIEANIDGSKEPLKGESKGKDGGFSLSIYQRNNGETNKIIQVDGFARGDGTLATYISFEDIQTITTKR